jgi:NADH:ubiquinone oxidoreductase subunit F (NADH-binding)
MKVDVIKKIEKNNLVGRGGAGFPTAKKWRMVADEKSDTKYIICNGAEGEKGVRKDRYILSHYPELVIDGIKTAESFLETKLVKVKPFLYLNRRYYHRFEGNVVEKFESRGIGVFPKPYDAGYAGGEETGVINAMEGKRIEPNLKPPYPPQSGLFGKPTLINNIETFYNVSLAVSDKFVGERFYTISGDVKNKGVFCDKDTITIESLLKKTGNFPDFEFFAQIGGDLSGVVLNKRQLKRKVAGAGSVTVYKLRKHSARKFIRHWVDEFFEECCGQCTPGREGIYRLRELISSEPMNWSLLFDILEFIDKGSFCRLCPSICTPVTSYIKNVAMDPENKQKVKLSNKNRSILENIIS